MLPDRNLLGQIEAIQVRLDKVYNQKFYMPTTPEGKAKLSKELAKFHAEQALKMVQKLPCSTEQKLELIDAVVEHLRSKQ